MTIHETIAKFKEQLDQWDADIARWETRARETGQQLNDTVKQQIDDIKAKSEDAKRRFADVEHATEAAANDVKEALDMAWSSLKMGVFAVRSEFESQEQKKDDTLSA